MKAHVSNANLIISKTERKQRQIPDQVLYLEKFSSNVRNEQKKCIQRECNVICNDYGILLTATSITLEPVLSIYVEKNEINTTWSRKLASLLFR